MDYPEKKGRFRHAKYIGISDVFLFKNRADYVKSARCKLVSNNFNN